MITSHLGHMTVFTEKYRVHTEYNHAYKICAGGITWNNMEIYRKGNEIAFYKTEEPN